MNAAELGSAGDTADEGDPPDAVEDEEEVVCACICACDRDSSRSTCTTESNENQLGMSSPERNILRNLVPDKLMIVNPFILAYSAVT